MQDRMISGVTGRVRGPNWPALFGCYFLMLSLCSALLDSSLHHIVFSAEPHCVRFVGSEPSAEGRKVWFLKMSL
jgi:hypothetical protein